HLFNVAYRYRSLVNTPYYVLPGRVDPRIKQTDISGIWPVNANWKLLARWNYDHSNSRNLESFAGIEWSNCCATIRLIGREWVDEDELFLPNIEPNRGIFVQFTLNGLGNLTGGGLSNLLSDGIWGFRETEYGQ
ncbi:MAG: LPS biosynthesis protein, partial [Gammaproteobacteria bacterium]|nr:LPS biosynthesis protein [Gammaproteobacteria bacterium]